MKCISYICLRKTNCVRIYKVSNEHAFIARFKINQQRELYPLCEIINVASIVLNISYATVMLIALIAASRTYISALQTSFAKLHAKLHAERLQCTIIETIDNPNECPSVDRRIQKPTECSSQFCISLHYRSAIRQLYLPTESMKQS